MIVSVRFQAPTSSLPKLLARTFGGLFVSLGRVQKRQILVIPGNQISSFKIIACHFTVLSRLTDISRRKLEMRTVTVDPPIGCECYLMLLHFVY
jgi:hypothetical protein